MSAEEEEATAPTTAAIAVKKAEPPDLTELRTELKAAKKELEEAGAEIKSWSKKVAEALEKNDANAEAKAREREVHFQGERAFYLQRVAELKQEIEKFEARIREIEAPKVFQCKLDLKKYKLPVAYFKDEPFVKTSVYYTLRASLNRFFLRHPTDKVLFSVPLVFGALGVGKTNSTALACIDEAKEHTNTLVVYVSVGFLLDNINSLNDYSVLQNKELAENVLSFCLWFALLRGTPFDPPKSIAESNLQILFDEISKNNVTRVLLHLDEVQDAPEFVKQVVRGCLKSSLGNVRVFPVLSGLSTLNLDMTNELKGSSWSIDPILLSPFSSDDPRLFKVFLQRAGLPEERGTQRELQLLFTDCGGVPRICVVLASVIKNHHHVSESDQKFGRDEASKIFQKLVNDLVHSYYTISRLHSLTGCRYPSSNNDANTWSHESFKNITEPVMKKLTLDVLVGEAVDENREVIPGVGTKYKDCFDRGLLFRTQIDSAVPFLPMFVVYAICAHWSNLIQPLVLVNPFEQSYDAFEIAALCSLHARMQKVKADGFGDYQSISKLRPNVWFGDTTEFQVEISTQTGITTLHAGPDARVDGAWFRLTESDYKGLDAVCCIPCRWRCESTQPWRDGRLKIGTQAKSGKMDSNTVLNQYEIAEAVEKAAEMLRSYGGKDANDVLLIDIVSDRSRQPSGYNLRPLMTLAGKQLGYQAGNAPFAISVTTREDLDQNFGPTLASRKRMRSTDPAPM